MLIKLTNCVNLHHSLLKGGIFSKLYEAHLICPSCYNKIMNEILEPGIEYITPKAILYLIYNLIIVILLLEQKLKKVYISNSTKYKKTYAVV